MYRSLTGDWSQAILAGLLIGLSWLGGYLITRFLFGKRQSESALVGLAVGLLLLMSFANLAAHFVNLSVAPWIASSLILATGIACFLGTANVKKLPAISLHDVLHLAVFLLLTVLFVRINLGLAIFDDYHNLPLISVMATDDVPPHFYANPELRLAYHYGLHVLAAILVRVGGLFPWFALDIVKGISIALVASLSWSLLKRYGRSGLVATAGAAVILLAGGSRWLLLLAPGGWLADVSERVTLMGSGQSAGPVFAESLVGNWRIEGEGPIPFPFAFANGIHVPPIMHITGSGAFPIVTVLSLLLIRPKRWTLVSAVVFSILLASLSLTSETLYVVLACGLAGACLLRLVVRRRKSQPDSRLHAWALVVGLSMLLVVLQGGVITEVVRGWLSPSGAGGGEGYYGYEGFQPMWPPAIISAHLGELSLADPGLTLVGLAEIGPVLLLAPLALRASWIRVAKRDDVLFGGLGLGSLLAFILSLFLRYGIERDTAKIMSAALIIWMLVAAVPISASFARFRWGTRAAVIMLICTLSLGGTVLFGIQIVASAQPTPSYFIEITDVLMCRSYWNQLEAGAQVLDRLPYRSATVFGRHLRSNRTLRENLDEWSEVIAKPDPYRVRELGYDYIYMDQGWWRGLPASERAAFDDSCVVLMKEETGPLSTFRRLYSVSGCGSS